ncbi:regulatory protein RecX [Schaalia sp. 19OD2882]|uniref:regulatory protein RecX n=1 Tax=Schaalia sp. 19OD2882 TaxID=2794089 RepID=UPI001C1EDF0B|nr:regulatory protein RecX [Schaalia sp. 19OD2882]QWW18960.1 regulatory protein RecX [Schaalia sp. 19OD2882]
MVKYLDPEDHPELGQDECSTGLSPEERARRMRERNAALTGAEAVEAAREVALRQLDSRARSSAQLRTAMTSRGFSDEVSDEVIERLTRVGLVDDGAYATALVRERFAASGKVGRALAEDLRRKGITGELAERAMADIDREDEVERARELVERKRRSLSGAPREVAWRRLSGALARKGYSGSVISSVVAEALARWGEESGESDDQTEDWA